ncbi:unnamed protein product [Brassica oleracea]
MSNQKLCGVSLARSITQELGMKNIPQGENIKTNLKVTIRVYVKETAFMFYAISEPGFEVLVLVV